MDDDTRPQDIHFAWEDVMEYKSFKAPKSGRRTGHHLAFSECSTERKDVDDYFDSDADASQWSETESNFSAERSSVAGSHSTRTTMSLGGFEDSFGDEDQIEFPSYDDGANGNSGGVPELCREFSALPSSSPISEQESRSPDAIEHAEDDVAISEVPSRHVDYLSHDWSEEDIWSSWKHLKSKRKEYSKRERLENAAWRIWGKERNNLTTITPESINWMKDRDVTWLYGPFQTIAKDLDLCYTSGAPVSTVSKTALNRVPHIRPILKKKTLSETLLQRSISTSSLVHQAATTALQDLEECPTESLQLTRNDSKKAVRFVSPRSSSEQSLSTPTKNVRFHHEVEQCIAVGHEGHDESEDEHESEDGLSIRYNKTKSSRPRLNHRTRSYSENHTPASTPDTSEAPPKIISSLPTTTLKSTTDSKHTPVTEKSAWNPCSYWFDSAKGTVRPLDHSAYQSAYDSDDEEDYIEAFTPTDIVVVSHQQRDETPKLTREGNATQKGRDGYFNQQRQTAANTEKDSTDSTATESDLDSDTQSTSDSYNVESDDTTSEDSGYGYIRDVNSRRSPTSTVGFLLDPARRDLVDRVMEEFWILFDQGWDSGFTNCASNSSDSSTSASTSTPRTSVASPQVQRKRQRINGDDTPEENEDRKSRQPRRAPAPKQEAAAERFACPFRKHDPREYNIYNNRVCALSHWESIARVKEHLYRCHQISPHCKRCWRTFKTQLQLDIHITVAATDICELQPGNIPVGITPAMERQLRSRKKSHRDQTDEERWKDMYKLLFPNEEIPSPYFEPVQTEGPASPDSRDLADYEDYIRRELPRLVRSNIEEVVRRETQPLEAALIGSLVGIIQDCQDRVFRSYRESQGVDQDLTPTARSPGNITSAPVPQVAWNEDWTADSLPSQSNFLDAAFEAPVETEQDVPDLWTFGQAQAGLVPFSDSGFASEPRCSCNGPCTCPVTIVDRRFPDGFGDIPRDASKGPTAYLHESTTYPPWQHVDPADDEADWWMNI
ncbi:Resistance to glucose repression protein [Lachnellula suecica]|uniref:Resistance to glucose repression protein n=1 Tax=Lachnellula suecica TaxID=602035 RepID=A0A8T9CDQ1_9HELO|nr:Resistance to glucose repression protein [Lachnellula suecica]